jgi:transposase InsO family protein
VTHLTVRRSYLARENHGVRTHPEDYLRRGETPRHGLHADRGSAMRSKPVALLLADLNVTKTHSLPYTSNDNPYSQSQFRTMKY